MTETKYRINFKPASTFNKRIDDYTKALEAAPKKRKSCKKAK